MGLVDVTPVNELPRLPRRAPDAHKGVYGKVLVLAGSRGMSGAAVLCGRAALRAGAGLVQVACPAAVQPEVAAGHPCYTTFGIRQHADGTFSEGAAADVVELARAANVLAIGPGLGRSDDVRALVRDVLRELPRTRTVVDADGLNALAPFTDEFRNRPVPLVLTPHPGEFARLAGAFDPELPADREERAVEFAGRFGVVLLLKGMNSLVTDGRRVYRNSTGNPGMATGGSGDVLTGVIAALLGQHLAPFDAAVLGAWAHGRAGDLAAGVLGQTGLTAADLPENLPAAFRELEPDR
jgi:NAD(P)H-hydrate epimerase